MLTIVRVNYISIQRHQDSIVLTTLKFTSIKTQKYIKKIIIKLNMEKYIGFKNFTCLR